MSSFRIQLGAYPSQAWSLVFACLCAAEDTHWLRWGGCHRPTKRRMRTEKMKYCLKIGENLPKLIEDMNPQIQESQ